MPNNEKWFKFNAYEIKFIKIRKKMTMMMKGVKHYVKYSMNVLTIKKKSCLFAKKRYIYMKQDVGDV